MCPSSVAVFLFVLSLPLASQGLELSGPLARPVGGDVFAHALTPDGARVVYVADERVDDLDELFAAPTDGTRASVRISANLLPGSEVQRLAPVPSPDGTRALYFVTDGLGPADLWSAVLDGTTPAVPLAERVFAARFDATGSQVLFSSDLRVAGAIELFRVASAGGETPQRLSGIPIGGGDVRPVQGAPCLLGTGAGGARAIYVADHQAAGRVELYSVPIDGSAAPIRLNGALVAGGNVQGAIASVPAEVSPDGTRVVYRADQEVDERYELYGAPIDAAGAAVKLSGTTIPAGDVDGGTLAPSFADVPAFRIAPDGVHVVFRADRVVDGAFALFVAPLDGSTPPVALTPTGAGSTVVEYDVTPDGRSVVFLVPSAGELVAGLHVVSLDPGPAPRLLNDPGAAGLPTGAFEPAFALDGTSRWAVYRALDPGTGASELFRVPLRGRRVRPADGGPAPFQPVRLSPGGLNCSGLLLEASTHAVCRAANEVHAVRIDLSKGPQRIDSDARPVIAGPLVVVEDPPRVVYRGREPGGGDELFAAPLDASTGPVPLNGVLALGPVTGDVRDLALTTDGEWVAFRADGERDELFELYAARTRPGSSAVRLNAAIPESAVGEGGVVSYRIHPAGAEVVYLATQPDHDGPAAYAVALEGGSPRLLGGPLAPGSRVNAVDLDPDGEHVVLALASDVFHLPRLASAPFAGGPRVDLSTLPMTDFVLLPAGGRVAFRTFEAGGVRRLFSVPVDGSGPATLLSGAAQEVLAVAVSPDGASVVFQTLVDDDWSLRATSADGTGPEVLLSGPVSGGALQELVFAPDGLHAAWIESAGSLFTLRAARLDGSSPPVLLAAVDTFGGAGLFGARVTDDSTRVAFLSGLVPELRIRPLDGSLPALSLSAGGTAVAFDLTPDGTAAVFWGDLAGFGRGVLRVALAGGTITPLGASFEPNTYGAIQVLTSGEVVFSVAVPVGDERGLYRVRLDGSGPHRRLHRPFRDGGGLGNALEGTPFAVAAGEDRVVFRAFRDGATQVTRLFLSTLERVALPAGAPQGPIVVR